MCNTLLFMKLCNILHIVILLGNNEYYFCNISTICVIFLLFLLSFHNLCNIYTMFVIFLALVVAQDLTDYVYWHFPNPHPFAFLKQVFLFSADTGIF